MIITYIVFTAFTVILVVCCGVRTSPWFCVTAVKISVLCVISAFEQLLTDVGLYKKAVLWQRNRTMPM